MKNDARVSQISDVLAEGFSHNPEIAKQVLLRAGIINHLQQLAVATLKPDQRTTMHFHEDLDEVFVVLSRSGVAEIDGDECTLAIGNCVHITPAAYIPSRTAANACLCFCILEWSAAKRSLGINGLRSRSHQGTSDWATMLFSWASCIYCMDWGFPDLRTSRKRDTRSPPNCVLMTNPTKADMPDSPYWTGASLDPARGISLKKSCQITFIAIASETPWYYAGWHSWHSL